MSLIRTLINCRAGASAQKNSTTRPEMKTPHTANCFFLSAFICVYLLLIGFPKGTQCAPRETPPEKIHDQTHLTFPLCFMAVCKERQHSHRYRSALILRNFENTKISIEPTLCFPYAEDAPRCSGALTGAKPKTANPRNLRRAKLVDSTLCRSVRNCLRSLFAPLAAAIWNSNPIAAACAACSVIASIRSGMIFQSC